MAQTNKPRSQAQRTRSVSLNRSFRLRLRPEDWLLAAGILVAIIIFIIQARNLWFTQDDAFISYRYAANALRGEGLVFNAGEHIEGYTNFLWVILLILAGSMGFGFDSVAKTLGLASGIGLIILAGIWTCAAWRELRWGNGVGPGVAASLLVAANGSVAYWAVSGLETAWFALWVSLAIWWWVRRSWLTVPALTIACLSRPEGAMIWGLLVLAEWIWGDGLPRALRLAGAGVILLAPYAAFKLWYYGSLLPNPFYAKTGLGAEYLRGGLGYAWLYMRQYGLYGVVVLLAVLSMGALPRRWRVIPVIWLVYAAYIVAVGGDVLKAHRFFVPGTVVLVLSILVGTGWLVRRFAPARAAAWSVAAFGLALAAWIGIAPSASLAQIREMELALTLKMTTVSHNLMAVDATNFSLAVSTIGKVSYDLLGHRVIDMLGLTDSTIARHPETIPGNVSTWRERNFNATYVLQQNPDYILFSTGHKPSAPAERALLLHKRYRRDYYTLLFAPRGGGKMLTIHKRKGLYNGPDDIWPSIQLAHDVNDALNLMIADKTQESFDRFAAIERDGPKDFPLPNMFMADLMRKQGHYETALKYADAAVAIDSFAVMAWWEKAAIYNAQSDTTRLQETVNHLNRLAPWLVGFW